MENHKLEPNNLPDEGEKKWDGDVHTYSMHNAKQKRIVDPQPHGVHYIVIEKVPIICGWCTEPFMCGPPQQINHRPKFTFCKISKSHTIGFQPLGRIHHLRLVSCDRFQAIRVRQKARFIQPCPWSFKTIGWLSISYGAESNSTSNDHAIDLILSVLQCHVTRSWHPHPRGWWYIAFHTSPFRTILKSPNARLNTDLRRVTSYRQWALVIR